MKLQHRNAFFYSLTVTIWGDTPNLRSLYTLYTMIKRLSIMRKRIVPAERRNGAHTE